MQRNAEQLSAGAPLPKIAPVNPLGYDEEGWRQVMETMGQPGFRARQLLKWIHGVGIVDYQQMLNLPTALRGQLQQQLPITPPQIASFSRAQDGVCKYVFAVSGGHCIEAVLIPAPGRMTLCISSQAGCALACVFCETGRQGFARHLTSAEIIGQLWAINFASEAVLPAAGITNIVLMGMGEPLLNLPAVEPALSLMFSDFGYGLARRRVTLSTAGVVPGIDALRAGPTLALSLHAPEDELRNKLVPLNRKYPIGEVLAACRRYQKRLPDRRKLTVEYTLLDGINDSAAQADKLCELLAPLPCKVNLIPCNPVAGLDFRPPSEAVMSAFAARIAPNLSVTLRRPRGLEIGAACGQLAGQVRARGKRAVIEVRHV